MLRVWFSLLLVLQARLIACTRTWPGGKYGLLKPITGCPRGFHGHGFLFQDTEDTDPSNNKSDALHIDGYFAKSEVLKYFCTKYNGTQYQHDTSAQWPSGQYCIYSKDATSKGMESGSIRMHDEKDNNHDAFKIDGEFVSIATTRTCLVCMTYMYDYTQLNFACQTRGNKEKPISLQITKPFYLLPYESRDCQQVKWMVATSEWIKYHTRDNSEENVKHGTVPYVELGNKNTDEVTMYYCYYESCWYLLDKKRGVFQSPGFPSKYPDGQLCSWRIMVPDNHTLYVHFTHFSLNGSNTNDYLRLSTKMNGTYRTNKTFYGVKRPFNVTATSHVRFLFRSDKKNNGYGFRAEYHVFTSRTYTGDYTERFNPNPSTTTQKTLPKTEGTVHSTMQASKKPISRNPDNDVSTKSPHSTTLLSRRTRLITAIVIPLTFVTIGILLVIIILYRCRSKERGKRDKSDARESILMDQPKNKTAAGTTKDDETRTCPPQSTSDTPEYESPDDLKKERTSTRHADIDNDGPEYHVLEPISNNVPDSDAGQFYQTLSRDQQPVYEAPDYSKHTPDMDSGTPEYHELEPIGNDVPDVLYHVLEGPDSNDAPSEDKMYQELDKETTHNPLYQHTSPVTMVTQNPLYDFSEK